MGLKEAKVKLRKRQNYPLEIKEGYTRHRIEEWYNYWQGQVYVAFSGGLDSTVLVHQVKKIYPEVPIVFVNTGMEFPENKEFVKTMPNCTWLKPSLPFHKVVKKYGYPVVSKKIARFIHDLQNPTTRNEATRNLRLTGYNREGQYCPTMILPKKWRFLIDAPFTASDKCCEVLKERPIIRYAKESGRKAMIGIMAADSDNREKEYLQNGCNMYNLKTPKSHPLGFWTTQDILAYILKYNIPYSKVYGKIVKKNGKLVTTGEQHTGCMFCMFGCHLEREPNRFQRMKITHPKYYNCCIEKLGFKQMLDFIGVVYT